MLGAIGTNQLPSKGVTTMANNQTNGTSTQVGKVTLGDVFKRHGIELLTYVDKQALVTNAVVFCILKAEKVPIANPKFDVTEQWQLTIAYPDTSGTVHKQWLTFTPNEIRDEHFTILKEALDAAYKEHQNAVHSCQLIAVPLSAYDNPFYALQHTDKVCECGLDG